MKKIAVMLAAAMLLFCGCAKELPQSQRDESGSELTQEQQTSEAETVVSESGTVYDTKRSKNYSFQQVKTEVTVSEPRFKVFIPCDPSVIGKDPKLTTVNLYGALKDFVKKGIYIKKDGVEVELAVPEFPEYKQLQSDFGSDETGRGVIRITDEEDTEEGEHIEDTYTIDAEVRVTLPNVEVRSQNVDNGTLCLVIDVKNDKLASDFNIEEDVVLEGSFSELNIDLNASKFDDSSVTLYLSGTLGASNEGRVRFKNGSLSTGYGATAKVETDVADGIYSPVMVNGSGNIRIYAVGLTFPDNIKAGDFKLDKGSVTAVNKVSSQLVTLSVTGVTQDANLKYRDYSCKVFKGTAAAPQQSALFANANQVSEQARITDYSWLPTQGDLSYAAAKCLGEDVYAVYERMVSGKETDEDKKLISKELTNAKLRIQNSAATLPYAGTKFMQVFNVVENVAANSPKDTLETASKTYAGFDVAELQMKILDGYFPFEHQGQKYLEYSARYLMLVQMNAGYADGAAFSGLAELFGLEKDSPRYVQTETEALYADNLPCGEGYALISNADKKLYLIKKNFAKMHRYMFNYRTKGYVTEYFEYTFPETEVNVQGKYLNMISDTSQLSGLLCRLGDKSSLKALTDAGYDFLYGSKYILLDPFVGQDYKYGYDVGGKGYVYDLDVTLVNINNFADKKKYPANEYYVYTKYKGAQNEEWRLAQRGRRQSYKCIWIYAQSEVKAK